MPKLRFFTQADNQPPTTQKEPKEPKTKKEKYRLTNWPEYNKSLINRGFMTIWLHEDTLAQWYYQGPRTPGGLFRYRTGGPVGSVHSGGLSFESRLSTAPVPPSDTSPEAIHLVIDSTGLKVYGEDDGAARAV
jgi:hypothetical protein